jgi:hypothetical protein
MESQKVVCGDCLSPWKGGYNCENCNSGEYRVIEEITSDGKQIIYIHEDLYGQKHNCEGVV